MITLLGRLLCYFGLHYPLLYSDLEEGGQDEEVWDDDGACICKRCGWKGFPTL